MQLLPFLSMVKQTVSETDQIYQDLYFPELHTEPIPFFGNPATAKVLTVGINPSAKEFSDGRWPNHEMPAVALHHRLTTYFTAGNPLPHPWFQRWSQALALIGASYEENAAHLDFSPRATKSMRICNRTLFRAMVAHDKMWLYQLLRECTEYRVVLMAGCMTTTYCHRFFQEHLPHDFEILPATLHQSGGSMHSLRVQGRTVLFFFSSSGPSAWNPTQLLTNLGPHVQQILNEVNL